jgi:hypothetical protein
MAVFKNKDYFEHSTNAVFDKIHEPGEQTPHSGIYRCEGCAVNAVSTHGHPLPPQNHHQHTANQGRIRWRLIAATH